MLGPAADRHHRRLWWVFQDLFTIASLSRYQNFFSLYCLLSRRRVRPGCPAFPLLYWCHWIPLTCFLARELSRPYAEWLDSRSWSHLSAGPPRPQETPCTSSQELTCQSGADSTSWSLVLWICTGFSDWLRRSLPHHWCYLPMRSRSGYLSHGSHVAPICAHLSHSSSSPTVS